MLGDREIADCRFLCRKGRQNEKYADKLLPLSPAAGSVHAAEVTPPDKAQLVCAACHGADGNSATDQFPLCRHGRVYLVGALRAYRDGRRIVRKRMNPQAEAGLSDGDIGKLAAYYAAQIRLTVKAADVGQSLVTPSRTPLSPFRNSEVRSVGALLS